MRILQLGQQSIREVLLRWSQGNTICGQTSDFILQSLRILLLCEEPGLRVLDQCPEFLELGTTRGGRGGCSSSVPSCLLLLRRLPA